LVLGLGQPFDRKNNFAAADVKGGNGGVPFFGDAVYSASESGQRRPQPVGDEKRIALLTGADDPTVPVDDLKEVMKLVTAAG
jgi:hypothetical protein